MEYPNRLKDLREDEDKTQTEVANEVHIHQTTLSKYEKGTIDIPTKILSDLAKYYRTSTDYILRRTNEKRPYKDTSPERCNN